MNTLKLTISRDAAHSLVDFCCRYDHSFRVQALACPKRNLKVELAWHEKSAFSLRSRRKHKAWGVSPRYLSTTNFKPANAGDRTNEAKMPTNLQRPDCRPFAWARNSIASSSWGLRPRLYACACSAG